MSNRTASESSDSISLFPFLGVLLCTMGAILVVSVTLVQRGAELPKMSAERVVELVVPQKPIAPSSNVDAAKQAELKKQLAEIAAYRKQLAELQAEGLKRLEDERARLSNSEAQARELEDKLAKLAIAAEQLKLTESNEQVDREQAAKELARLEQLVIDTEKQVEELRKESAGKKSYAIVPYKGRNGTYRRPIYIECTGKAIIIQPEGLKLTADDFIAPAWPGNPLAAVLRASREYLNAKAAKAGEPEPPDPYPLIIVRPSGIHAYISARRAISSWDSDYGYEFINEDMKLAFPEAPDPQLAQVQYHALLSARERLVHLVQAAPSRFAGVQLGDGATYGGGGGSGGGGFATGDSNKAYGGTGGGGSEFGGQDSQGEGGGDDGWASGGQGDEQGASGGSSSDGNEQFGAMSGMGGNNQTSGQEGSNGSPHGNGNEGTSATNANVVGSRYAQSGGGGTNSDGGTNNAPSDPLHGKDKPNGAAGNQTAGASGGSAGSSSGSPGSGTGAMSGGTPNTSFSSSQGNETIAASKGANWAVNQPRQKSAAIRRMIRVVVRENKMVLMPVKSARDGVEATGREISLDQPIDKISDEFADAVKDRIEEWGLAGSGMYWRPVLELNVEPNAQLTATRITHLLKDSGVEVQLPETAQSGSSSGGVNR